MRVAKNSEDNTESHHTLGPCHDSHDHSLPFWRIIQLGAPNLSALRFRMHDFTESWSHLRVLCRKKLEGRRSGISLRGPDSTWKCRNDIDIEHMSVSYLSGPSVQGSATPLTISGVEEIDSTLAYD